MKRHTIEKIVLIYLFLNTFFLAVTVKAVDYECQSTAGHLTILQIKSFNEDLAKEYYGKDDSDIEDVMGKNAEIGAMSTFRVKSVKSMKEGDGIPERWEIRLLSWDEWTTNREDFNDDDKQQCLCSSSISR